MRLVAFDLDGCLVDSRQVVRDAYREAGVTAPPNVLELEGVGWIRDLLHADPTYQITEEGYDRVIADIRYYKAKHYLLRIGKAKMLPPYQVARRLRRQGWTCVALSGAPVGALDQVRRRHGFTWPFVSHVDGVRTSTKQTIMLSMARDLRPHEVPVYVDDQQVDVPKPWRFVWYRGQTEEELYQEVRDT